MRLITVAILIVGLLVVFGEKTRFDNYRVFSVSIKNENQLNVLRELEIEQNEILFRAMPTMIGQIVDLIVPPHKLFDIYELFSAFEFNSQTKTENLQKLAKYNSKSIRKFIDNSENVSYFCLFRDAH